MLPQRRSLRHNARLGTGASTGRRASFVTSRGPRCDRLKMDRLKGRVSILGLGEANWGAYGIVCRKGFSTSDQDSERKCQGGAAGLPSLAGGVHSPVPLDMVVFAGFFHIPWTRLGGWVGLPPSLEFRCRTVRRRVRDHGCCVAFSRLYLSKQGSAAVCTGSHGPRIHPYCGIGSYFEGGRPKAMRSQSLGASLSASARQYFMSRWCVSIFGSI